MDKNDSAFPLACSRAYAKESEKLPRFQRGWPQRRGKDDALTIRTAYLLTSLHTRKEEIRISLETLLAIPKGWVRKEKRVKKDRRPRAWGRLLKHPSPPPTSCHLDIAILIFGIKEPPSHHITPLPPTRFHSVTTATTTTTTPTHPTPPLPPSPVDSYPTTPPNTISLHPNFLPPSLRHQPSILQQPLIGHESVGEI